MKHRISLILVFILFMPVYISAGPIHERVFTLVQPDGCTFQAKFSGDEFVRIKTTLSGAAIIQDTDGWWSYAFYDPEGKKYSSRCHVGDKVSAELLSRSRDIPTATLCSSASRYRAKFPGADTPLLERLAMKRNLTKSEDGGEELIVKHGIVILAEFANMSFKYGREDFVALLTAESYSRNGATGCAKKFFDDQFNAAVDFRFDVSEIVTLPRDLDYYGANVPGDSNNETDRNPAQMIMDACSLADPDVDFSLYDDDGDGEVDNVFVFFAGGDEAEGAGDDCIWSHAWYIREGAGRSLILDGKVINRYACTSELSRAGQDNEYQLAGIGTFCHEFSHTLGLADMYDTDYDASGGEAEALWQSTSLMDGGNYNDYGHTPPFFNAIEREMTGLSEAEIIEKDGAYYLEPIHRSGRYYRINTDVEDEYYLLECRAEESWDRHIGGSGLLVYHIDKSKREAGHSDTYGESLTADMRWHMCNEVNCRPDHQCADLIEAMSGASNVRNVFYPHPDRTEISADELVYWSGGKGYFSITGIRMKGDVVHFNVVGADINTTPPAPVKLSSERFQDAAIISFESDRIFEGEAMISWGKTGKEPKELTIMPYEPGKYALVLEGLEPRTSYTVNISFAINDVVGKEGTVSFMTNSFSGRSPYIYLKNVLRSPDGSFPIGSKLPLRVYNSVGAERVDWTLRGKSIEVDESGYYRLSEGGLLKAVVYWKDGGRDVIIKEITVK